MVGGGGCIQFPNGKPFHRVSLPHPLSVVGQGLKTSPGRVSHELFNFTQLFFGNPFSFTDNSTVWFACIIAGSLLYACIYICMCVCLRDITPLSFLKPCRVYHNERPALFSGSETNGKIKKPIITNKPNCFTDDLWFKKKNEHTINRPVPQTPFNPGLSPRKSNALGSRQFLAYVNTSVFVWVCVCVCVCGHSGTLVCSCVNKTSSWFSSNYTRGTEPHVIASIRPYIVPVSHIVVGQV